jgi:hypothetical protein
MTMLSRTKIALALAIVLGAASAAMAATTHPAHHHRAAVKRQLSGAGAYGYASSVTCPGGPCDPYNHQQVKCFVGVCNLEWGLDSSE